MKLRATLVWEYDLTDNLKERQATYQTIDPVECAAIDQENGGLAVVEATLGLGTVNKAKFTVEPVEAL